MDLLGMIAELRQEWERLNEAIEALERVRRGTGRGRGRTSKPVVPPGESRTGSEGAAYGADTRKQEKLPANTSRGSRE